MPVPVMPQIENIVFLMLENRSFDNVLGWLYVDGPPEHVVPNGSGPFDGLRPNAFANPAYTWTGSVQNYQVVPIPGQVDPSERVPAYNPYEEFKTGAWNGVMNQIFGDQNRITGLPLPPSQAHMLGFLQDYYASYMLGWKGLDILWTYTPDRLPVINGLARQFAVSDRWFCSVPTQTNPNRAYSLCGTSLGREANANLGAVEQYDVKTVFNLLAAAGKSWGIYYTDRWISGLSYTEYTFPKISDVRAGGEVGGVDQFMKRAAAGNLPDFTYLEPAWGYGKGALYKQGTDYHPPTHVSPGEEFLSQIYRAIRRSPQWPNILLIVTFDEHGGTYDHVAPPWGAINPDGMKGESGFNFDLFGVRVPTILVSPFVNAGTVFRAEGNPFPYDHTSFIKTLLLWAGVDPASANMGNRMPAAPTFERIFENSAVNLGTWNPEGSPGAALDEPQVNPNQPLNAMLEGVGAAVTHAILHDNDSLAGIHAAIDTYRRDPEQFEAKLTNG
jgi:phospholipase C